MNMQATDLSAKLLATENLTVVREARETASFDIESRVLTIPLWKDMTPEIENMLIGHEVGHALYTGNQYIEPIRELPKLMSYMNILEDVRIEKLIKRKYPGLRKRMNEGYKQLNDRDFFGVKSVQNFDSMLLIDKINLYFKAGFQCGVTFDADEKEFVNRAERTETIDEVIQLSKDIYQFSKEKAEEKKKEQAQAPQEEEDEETMPSADTNPDYDPEDTPELDDDIPDETPDQVPPPPVDPVQTEQEELESKTERAFQSKLQDLADTSTQYKYWTLSDDYFDDPVLTYKEILAETLSPKEWENHERNPRKYYRSDEYYDTIEKEQAKDYEKFMVESVRTVGYLVKEFEMRKSAQLFKRAQTSKVGSLDMRKIYAYKLQDDLFKRVTVLPQGKNHGMIMLLDWSGSMGNVMRDTLKQVINLAMFCNRVQIPFRVLAFSSDYQKSFDPAKKEQYRAWVRNRNKADVVDASYGFTLLELFSNKMSKSEFNSMCHRVLDYRFQYNHGFGLGGTPLNQALAYCYNKIGDYIKLNNIEKTTLITLTDGEGSAFQNFSESFVTYDPTYKKVNVKNFIKDPVTKKNYYMHPRNSTQQTETLLRMIKDRHNVTIVGFYICENRRRSLVNAIRANLTDFKGDEYAQVEDWRKGFKADGFVSISNTGRDDLFLIPQSSTVINDSDLEVDATASAKSIARNFSKYLNAKKTSRILLNRFVSMVA